MARRMEMPPLCARCEKPNPQYGGYCKECVGHATWMHAIQHAWDPNQVRVDGYMYDVRPETPPTPGFREPTGGKGFGGRRFVIRFHDGRVVETRNLWMIGIIPDEYREALPDNAVFDHVPPGLEDRVSTPRKRSPRRKKGG